MAKQVTQLNQTAERIVQLLDTVDAAVSSANDTLFWTTKTTNGKTTLTPIAIGRVVDSLPETGESHLDYFVKQDYIVNEEPRFTYIHYKWINGAMVAINDVEVKMYNSACRLKYGNIMVQPARIIINKYNLIF